MDFREKPTVDEERGINGDIALFKGERLDSLDLNGYFIIQNPDKFCFGMDAVLLSGFVEASEGEKVLDLGCGNGILPILLSVKTAASHFTALEIQPDIADMARRSVSLNGLRDRIEVLEGDIRGAESLLKKDSFDVIVSNPPYIPIRDGRMNPGISKSIARHEVLCTLEDLMKAARYLLKMNGRLYMVHRPSRLADVLISMRKHGIEPKLLRFVHSGIDKTPSLFLIMGRKGGGMELKVQAPLILYSENGAETEELKKIYGK